MKAKSKRTSSDQAKGFREVALIFNDQQIVTGLAIMIAAFAQWSSISVYHHQIAIYLGWVCLICRTAMIAHSANMTLQLSSTVHLTVLTYLHRTVYPSGAVFGWRLIGILTLFVMIVVGLVPTLNGDWDQLRHNGTPTRCLWALRPDSINLNGVVSMMTLILSYAWKIGSLFDVSRNRLRWLCRAWPEYLLELVLAWDVQRTHHVKLLGRPIFKIVMVLYFLHELLWEFA